MISGHDVTSIHMTLKYTCSNILSSATILLGPLSISFSSQWKMLCSFRHTRVSQISFSLCLEGGEDTLLQSVLAGVAGLWLPSQLLSFLFLSCGFYTSASSPAFLSSPVFLTTCPICSLTSSAFQEMAFGFRVAQSEYLPSCKSFRLP